MFTNDEGEGWQQLGEGLMPSSAKDANFMLDGFKQMGEQTLHSVLGGSTMPDLKDALGAMYGSPPLEYSGASTKFPDVNFFDSSAGAAASPSGLEASAAPAAPSGGFESVGAGLQAAPTGGLESAGMQAGLQAAPAGGFESAIWQPGTPTPPGGFESAIWQPGSPTPAGGFESVTWPGTHVTSSGGIESIGMQSGAAPGTIETLQGPGFNPNTAGMEGGSYFKAGPGADSVGNVSDASSSVTDIGKAFSDIMGKMSDMLGAMTQGPMGLLGGLLNFLLTIFSEILSSMGKVLEETARAAASLAAETWKKHLEMTT